MDAKCFGNSTIIATQSCYTVKRRKVNAKFRLYDVNYYNVLVETPAILPVVDDKLLSLEVVTTRNCYKPYMDMQETKLNLSHCTEFRLIFR